MQTIKRAITASVRRAYQQSSQITNVGDDAKKGNTCTLFVAMQIGT